MPPPRTGTVEELHRRDGSPYYRVRVRLADGSRERLDVPERYATRTKDLSVREHVEFYAAAMQEREDETGELLAKKRARQAEAKKKHDTTHGETCEKYFARHTGAREAEGVRDVRKERTIWGKWLSPRIGARPVAAVTRDEIEAIRDVLDAHVRERIKRGLEAGISGATAANVWSVLRTMFKEACGSRDRTLRVRTDDPTQGHKPPLTTAARKKTFIYPNEAIALLACKAIDRRWREAYAIALYCYARPEELQAVTWRDVDFAAKTISISKAIAARSGEPKPLPKTEAAVRDVPIDPALVPLLERMHEEADDDDTPILPVLGELNDKFRAKQLREHLKFAGVTRERLFAETVTLLPVNFRSTRDSGVTWLALAGVSIQAIRARAGHEDIDTTLGYVKMAEDLAGKVGAPFPPLPIELVGNGHVVENDHGRSGHVWPKYPKRVNSSGISVPEEGVEGAGTAENKGFRDGSRPEEPPPVDVSVRPPVAIGPNEGVVDSDHKAARPTLETLAAGLASVSAQATELRLFGIASRAADDLAKVTRKLEDAHLDAAGVARLDTAKRRKGR